MATPIPYDDIGRGGAASFEPTPSVNVNASPAAFGVNIGEAIQHLGQVQEGAGKELFDRAYAMQELQLHADVNSRLADTQNKMLDRTLQHNSLEGKASVDDLNPYFSDLDKIRSDGGQGLPPMGTEMYDTESRQSRFRLAYSGAVQSKDEQRKYIVGSSKAVVSSLESEVQLDPDNPGANAIRLGKVKEQLEFQNQVGGLAPGDAQSVHNTQEGISSFLGANIRGLADRDPFKGQKLLNEAIADKNLTPGVTDAYGRNNIERLQDYVDGKLRTVGGRVVATETMSGTNARFGDVVVSKQQLLAGLKGSEGGSYTFSGPDVTDKAGNTGHAIGHYGVMSYNLANWLAEAGMPSMSEAEFKKNPEAQDNLAAFKMDQYQTKYGSANAAAIAWFGGEGSVGANLSKLHDKNMDGLTYLKNFNQGLAQGASLRDVREVGAKVADEHIPGDPLFAESADKNVVAAWETNQRMLRDDEFNNRQTIDNALVNGDQNGKLPTTPEELTMSPGVKEAYDNLNGEDRLKVLGQLIKNSQEGVRMTEGRLAVYDNLIGEATHDPQKFLKEDILGADLPIGTKKELLNLRQRVFKGEEADPNISRALRIPAIVQQLQDLSITKKDDPDNLNLFSASLGDQIKLWTQDKGKPPNQEETESIATRLLQNVAATGWRGSLGIGGRPFFEVEAPYDWAVNAKALAQKTNGYTPTDQEVQRWWTQMQYIKKYSTPAGPDYELNTPPSKFREQTYGGSK